MWLPTAVACSFSFCSAVHGSVTTRVCVLLMAGFWAVASLGLLQMYPEVKTPGHKASSVPVIIVMLVSVMSWCPGHPSSPALHPLSSPRRSLLPSVRAQPLCPRPGEPSDVGARLVRGGSQGPRPLAVLSSRLDS